VLVNVLVETTGQASYVVSDVRLEATRKAGDATVERPWVGFQPEFPAIVGFRDANDVAISGATVVFRRTAGRRLFRSGVPIDSVSGTTEPDGYLRILERITTDTTGSVIGDVEIRLPSGAVHTFNALAITAVPDFRQQPAYIVFRLAS
jgi:hypothetical protein